MNQSSKEYKPKIFVAGSSWARGEWAPDRPVILHNGIKQYFTDYGYTIIDCSQSRSYHSRVIHLLDKKLTQHYKHGDVVIFIMADPLLDLIMPELSTMQVKRSMDVVDLPLFTEAIKQAGGLINLIRHQQDHIYSQLDAVAKKYDVQVHCIGGTYNVNINILDKYNNLVPTIISWIYLLVGQYKEHPRTDHPEFGISYTWSIDYIDFTKFDLEFAKQVQDEFKTIEDSTKIMHELIFQPDGLHPNREGHKILFDNLVKKLNL